VDARPCVRLFSEANCSNDACRGVGGQGEDARPCVKAFTAANLRNELFFFGIGDAVVRWHLRLTDSFFPFGARSELGEGGDSVPQVTVRVPGLASDSSSLPVPEVAEDESGATCDV